jgi:uncharacterized protein YgiM (DUF1202 family)
MRRFFRFSTYGLILLLAAALAGCFIRPRNAPVAPMPLSTLTPGLVTSTPPIVMTATRAATGLPGTEATNPPPQPGGTAEGPTPGSGPTLAPTPGVTDVKAVLVKDDVRLRTGPGAGYDVLGLAHPGMTLLVTGKSSDDAWWQVRCDQGPNNICWVSADPELTEPTTP